MYSHFIAKHILPTCNITFDRSPDASPVITLHLPKDIQKHEKALGVLRTDLARNFTLEEKETETALNFSLHAIDEDENLSLASLVQHLAANYDLSVEHIAALCPKDMSGNILSACTGEGLKDLVRIEDTPNNDRLEITVTHGNQSKEFLSWLGRLYDFDITSASEENTKLNLIKRRDTHVSVSESEALVDLARNLQQGWNFSRSDALEMIYPESARNHTERVLSLRPAPQIINDLHHSYTQDIAIIGSGFSGIATAIKVLEDVIDNPTEGPIHISLLERTASRFAGGLAYGASNLEHHVNVPSAFLSFDSENSNDFVEFLKNHTEYAGDKEFLKLGDGLIIPADNIEEAAVQRRLYQYYLTHRLYETVQQAKQAGVADVEIIFDDVEPGIQKNERGYELTLASGRDINATKVVFATGHGAVKAPGFLREAAAQDDSHIVLDQWNESDKLTGLLDDRDVSDLLVLGTGLSAMDVVMSAQRHGFFERGGTLTLLSRSGHLHPVLESDAAQKYKQPDVTLQDLGDLPASIDDVEEYVASAFTLLRQRGNETIGRDHTDEEIFFALSPLIPEFIRSCPHLDIGEMSTLLKKYGSLINTTAVPMAGVIGAAFHELVDAGKVIVKTGNTRTITPEGNNVILEFNDGQSLTTQGVISTLPPASDPAATPIYKSLVDEGTLSIEPRTGIGLDVDTQTMQAVSNNGQAHPDIFIIGPVVGGDTMADFGYIGPKYQIISGLRDQAKRIADTLQTQRQETRRPTIGLLIKSTPDLQEAQTGVNWRHALEDLGLQVLYIPSDLPQEDMDTVLEHIDGIILNSSGTVTHDEGTVRALAEKSRGRNIPTLNVGHPVQEKAATPNPLETTTSFPVIRIEDAGLLRKIYGTAAQLDSTHPEEPDHTAVHGFIDAVYTHYYLQEPPIKGYHTDGVSDGETINLSR